MRSRPRSGNCLRFHEDKPRGEHLLPVPLRGRRPRRAPRVGCSNLSASAPSPSRTDMAPTAKEEPFTSFRGHALAQEKGK